MNVLLNVLKQWKTNLVPIIWTKRRKNPEFHMVRLTEILCVKGWKFHFWCLSACLSEIVYWTLLLERKVITSLLMLMAASSWEKIKWKDKKCLPGGFYDTISGKVKTMANSKKVAKWGKNIVLDPEVINARVLALRYINPDLDFKKLLVYELALYPSSMFNERGAICSCNQKLKLMTGLKVVVSTRTVSKPDVFLLYSCTIFWLVAWPSKETFVSFV